MRELNEHPDTVFTVLTGEGRFFSSGADVKADRFEANFSNDGAKKLAHLARFSPMIELIRSIVDHKKVFVLALNGPAVGGGAAWFEGVADIILAAEGAYLQVPFNALGLVPENGSAPIFSHHIGVHRANDFLMFGRQLTVEELERWGMVNRIFPKENFQKHVIDFLEEQLRINDGGSMMETKRLQNAPLRDARMIAVLNSIDALAERFVKGVPTQRFIDKRKLLECESYAPQVAFSYRIVITDLLTLTSQPKRRIGNPSFE